MERGRGEGGRGEGGRGEGGRGEGGREVEKWRGEGGREVEKWRGGERKVEEGKVGEGKAGEGKAGEGKVGEGKVGEGKVGEGKVGEVERERGRGEVGEPFYLSNHLPLLLLFRIHKHQSTYLSPLEILHFIEVVELHLTQLRVLLAGADEHGLEHTHHLPLSCKHVVCSLSKSVTHTDKHT